MARRDPTIDGSLPEIWAFLHKQHEFTFHEGQRHYLTSLAMMSDDDLAAQLLLKKLKRARFVGDQPDDAVALNSAVEFTFGTVVKRRVQVVHPSWQHDPGTASANSLVGAGLLGLRARQTIFWPDEEGRLTDLHVIRVSHQPLSHGPCGREARLHG